MKSTILLFTVLFAITTFAEELKVNTYGNSEDEAIIFLHGGPGYNAANFDITTAERLLLNVFREMGSLLLFMTDAVRGEMNHWKRNLHSKRPLLILIGLWISME